MLTPLKLLWPSKHRLSILIANPAHRLPVLEDMLPDINNVIRTQASKFCDETNASINSEELIGEGNLKLSKIIHAGWLDRVPNRMEFFKFFTASVANHFRGLVHRHIFTQKRTGVKPPKKGEQAEPGTLSPKQVNVSIDVCYDDNPRMQAQFADETGPSTFDDTFVEDISPSLTAMERLVLQQLVSPNIEALTYAQMDSTRCNKPNPGGVKKVKIKIEHMAIGLGMELSVFSSVQEQLRLKVKRYMSNKEDHQYNAAIRQLEEAFEIQIPKSIDPLIVRRILTLAARERLSKLTPELEALLRIAGAKVPEQFANSVSCFGVLYSRADSICHSCGLRVACATEAASYGLGEITISPALLGTKQTRIPVLAPRASGGDPVFSSSRDEEIYAHLCEHFDKVPVKNEIYFRHRDGVGGGTAYGRSGMIICLDESTKYRFVKPSDVLCRELVKLNGSWTMPDDATVTDALELINTHAGQSYST